MTLCHAFMMKLSYAVFSPGMAWASLMAVSAASQFLAVIASWAALSGFASLALTGGAAGAAAAAAVPYSSGCASTAMSSAVSRMQFFTRFLMDFLNVTRPDGPAAP